MEAGSGRTARIAGDGRAPAKGQLRMFDALRRPVGERLDECAAVRLDCRQELGEWAAFRTQEYSPESLESVKRIWEFKGAFEDVFGRAQAH